jgi:hypothetical protein
MRTFFPLRRFKTLALAILAGSAGPNTAPTASNVVITGTIEVGQTLTVTYDYSDPEEGTESGTTFQWYRVDDMAGTNPVAISGATSSTYEVQLADLDYHLRVIVIPSDGALTGSPAASTPVPVVFTPLALTEAGFDLFWLDFSDVSKLFTDAAGTVPVTTTGDRVRSIRAKGDYSKLGVFSTAGAYPFWSGDGDVGFVVIAATDTSIHFNSATGNGVPLANGGTKLSRAIALRPSTTDSIRIGDNWEKAPPVSFQYYNVSNVLQAYAGEAGVYVTLPPEAKTTSDVVYRHELDVSVASTAASARVSLMKDGTKITPSGSVTGATISALGTDEDVYVGSGGAGGVFLGRMYQYVAFDGIVTGTLATQLDTWMANKSHDRVYAAPASAALWRLYVMSSGTNVTIHDVTFYDASGAEISRVGVTAAASSQFSGSYLPAYAVDADLASRWASNNDGVYPEWLSFTFPSPVTVDRVRVKSSTGAGDHPGSFRWEYSADGGTSWVVVGAVLEPLPSWASGEYRWYDFGAVSRPAPFSRMIAWYDPSDRLSLYQNTAGTTVVTANGQTVDRMEDRSRSGSHVTQQNTAVDATYVVSGSEKYLDTVNGADSNQGFQGAFTAINGLNSASMVVGFVLNEANNDTIMGVSNVANDGILLLHILSTGAPRLYVGGSIFDFSGATVTVGSKYVVAGVVDFNAVAGNEVRLWLNDVELTCVTATANTAFGSAANINVGRWGSTTGESDIHFYGGVITNHALSTVERETAQDWYAAKMGITL